MSAEPEAHPVEVYPSDDEEEVEEATHAAQPAAAPRRHSLTELDTPGGGSNALLVGGVVAGARWPGLCRSHLLRFLCPGPDRAAPWTLLPPCSGGGGRGRAPGEEVR